MENTEINPAKPSGQSGTQHHRRRRSHSSHRSRARIRRYKYLLAGITTLFLMTWIFTWLHVSGKSREHQQAILQLRKLEAVHQETTAELEKVRTERDSLIEGRIPDLLPLKFDEAIGFDNGYVRNVIFTLVRNGKDNIYEYRLVLSNDTLSVIRPDVELYLFNDIGIQIGNAKVQASNATSNVERFTLEPGEVRSYSAAIDMMREGEPSYFLLKAAKTEGKETDTPRKHLGDVIAN